MTQSNFELIPTESLNFDPRNPRLAEYEIGDGLKPEEILEILWEAMDVQELVQSIAASGFFPHEALVVAHENGQEIVIEGNRRLAAVQMIRNPNIAAEKGWEVPKVAPEIRAQLDELPIIRSSREEAWRYLGFKHVNGPAKWGSYAKAVYIAEVRREFNVPLADIANQIGDRHRTVQRLYRGLMVLEQAEREKLFDRNDRYNKRFAFSHLYTGLDYEGIASYLGVADKVDESETPVPTDKLDELKNFCLWLYGSKKEKQEPAIISQNPHLRQLNSVLTNREATQAMRAGVPLSKAFEISRPPRDVFESALIAAKRELTTARGYLTTGYDNSEQILKIAGSIANIADDIYRELEHKLLEAQGQTKKQRVSE